MRPRYVVEGRGNPGAPDLITGPFYDEEPAVSPEAIATISADSAKRGALSLWTIYDRPLDHPDGFLARRHESGETFKGPTSDAFTGDLETLRQTFRRAGLTVIPREPNDDPRIVETWL